MKPKDIENLIGEVVEIIYEDKAGKITQRRIEVHGHKAGLLRTTCFTSGGPRVFRVERILAWRRDKVSHAG